MALPDILPHPILSQNSLRKDTHVSDSTISRKQPSEQRIHYTLPNDPDVTPHRARSTSLDDHTEFRIHPDQTSKSLSGLAAFKTPPDTPAARTGPPRSLSFAYALPGSPSLKNTGYFPSFIEQHPDTSVIETDLSFTDVDTGFRGALEPSFLEQDRKGKRRVRERSPSDDSWNINPMKWFQESPREERPGMDFPPSSSHPPADSGEETDHPARSETEESEDPPLTFLRRPRRGLSVIVPPTSSSGPSPISAKTSIRRAFSVPHPISSTEANKEKEKTQDKEPSVGNIKWAKLRSLIPHILHSSATAIPGPSMVTSQAVNITDELITGGLSTLMLRLWFERDERGHRRIPILFHRLRIRVSDSLHPMKEHGSVFRIECEYANGAVRWVVYRQMRDFLSLHGHYAVSNVYNKNVDKMPEFPTTSIPYFKFLRKEYREKGGKLSKAEFARLQREALENYLISLIRGVMFHPSSNRLAGFLEISALSITLAQSGGCQYKAGYLRIEAVGNGSGFGRKSASWMERRESRWCAVRESYLVVLEEPGELTVWDVFLLDSDFKIERPKRYYRLLQADRVGADQQPDQHTDETKRAHHHHHHQASGSTLTALPPHIRVSSPDTTAERQSIMSSIKSRVSRIFHSEHPPPSPHSQTNVTGRSHPNDATDDDGNLSDDGSSDSIGSSTHSEMPTPMLDPSTNTNPLLHTGVHDDDDRLEANEASKKKDGTKKVSGDVSKHTFYVVNSQLRLKLFARNERQMLQFITALEKTAAISHYTGGNRFDSFAPIRLNVAAQWLVDGRDYFWNLSRAILLAKESIYIHDWWLSPELQMRRPNKDRYRLDHLLESKAKEGVKIYIILYQEVSNRTTPTDSNYAKQRLVGLHPNVMVQRSPSHFQTGTFYWAHHEKMCVIDQTIAFMGGLDLCFGRWDTPQHVLTDDTADTDREQIWPGKDYSNPRLADFHNLHKPEEDMYDRTKVPRMPWHDVAMQIVGQPARDLARHFVQRWNYLLRIKNHSRVMPFLLPPPEFRPGELTQMGLTGTCELQICRSAGPWSLGTPGRIEHSIQNAYLKAIQMSEHFVYIENQFFITSTVVNDVKIENNIGDAIVHRIIRAHRDGTPWKCCILIPSLPGFTFPVDHSDASAIRIILECQNKTIARGPNSIFSRLRKEGINPDDYIAVFSLRNWAKMRGDVLTTEQVYIHAKVCIVDDRLAIIGSANINERSQRGDRDSELAAVIRDTDMIDSTMAGKPFKVGRFAHTLRVRLMREHLGIDVDALDEDDLMTHEPVKPEHKQEIWDPDQEQALGGKDGVTHIKKSKIGAIAKEAKDNISQAVDAGAKATTSQTTKALHTTGLAHQKPVGQYFGDQNLNKEPDNYNNEETALGCSDVPTLEDSIVEDQLPSKNGKNKDGIDSIGNARLELQNVPNGRVGEPGGDLSDFHTGDGVVNGAPAPGQSAGPDDEPRLRLPKNNNEEEPTASEAKANLRDTLTSKPNKKGAWTVPTCKPEVGQQDFEDPISDAFWKDKWVASAVHNTEIYRKVFHAVPDDLISTWKQYKEFVSYHDRLNKPTRGNTSGEPVARVPSESGEENLHESQTLDTAVDGASQTSKEEQEEIPPPTPSYTTTTLNEETPKPRRPARGSEPFEKWERDEMEKLLGEVNGQLVVFPTRFLEGEDIANNFLFNADRLLPLPIYN